MIVLGNSSLQVELKDPVFGDSTDTSVRVKVKTMMDGSLRTRRATPFTTKLVMRFVEVSRRKALEVKDFIIATQGQRITLIDWNTISWSGYLTTDPTDIITDGRGQGNTEPRKESNNFQLEFEGRLL